MNKSDLKGGTYDEFKKDLMATQVALDNAHTLLATLCRSATILYWNSGDAKDARAMCDVYNMLAEVRLKDHIGAIRKYFTYTCNVALFLSKEAKALDLFDATADTDKDIKITQEELLTYFNSVKDIGFNKKFFQKQNNEAAGKRSRGETSKRVTDTSTAASTVGAFGDPKEQELWVDTATSIADCPDATLRQQAMAAATAILSGKVIARPVITGNDEAQAELTAYLDGVEMLNALGDTKSNTGKMHSAAFKLAQLTKAGCIKMDQMTVGFPKAFEALAQLKLVTANLQEKIEDEEKIAATG